MFVRLDQTNLAWFEFKTFLTIHKFLWFKIQFYEIHFWSFDHILISKMENEKEKLNDGAKKEFSATEAIIGKDPRN